MTRIWIEFDDLNALKDNLARIEYQNWCQFTTMILAKIGFNVGKMTDAEILNEVREYCTRFWIRNPGQTMGGFKPFEAITEDERKHFGSLADYVIQALKQKGDVR